MSTGPGITNAPAPAPVPWYYRPVWVLLLLFVILGPFGLPYLWRSPRFSQRMKILLTVLVALYTATLVRETLHIMSLVEEELDSIGNVPGF